MKHLRSVFGAMSLALLTASCGRPMFGAQANSPSSAGSASASEDSGSQQAWGELMKAEGYTWKYDSDRDIELTVDGTDILVFTGDKYFFRMQETHRIEVSNAEDERALLRALNHLNLSDRWLKFSYSASAKTVSVNVEQYSEKPSENKERVKHALRAFKRGVEEVKEAYRKALRGERFAYESTPQTDLATKGEGAYSARAVASAGPFARRLLGYFNSKSQYSNVHIDDDGDVVFKHDGVKYFASVDEDTPDYLRLVAIYENNLAEAKVLEAANEVNTRVKVVKVAQSAKNKSLWFASEQYLEEPADLDAYIRNGLSTMQTGRAKYSGLVD